MAKRIYLAKPRISKQTKAENFFDKGLTVAGAILLALKEGAENFSEGLPSYYNFDIVKRIYNNPNKKSNPEVKQNTVYVNLHRLQKQGLIIKDPKEKVFVLTPEGKKVLLEIENRQLVPKNPWDKKLRIIAFDIPEAKKLWRQWLRGELLALNFKKLQASVYIGKHPLPQSFYKEIVKQELIENVVVLTVGEIDNKEKILELFNKS